MSKAKIPKYRIELGGAYTVTGYPGVFQEVKLFVDEVSRGCEPINIEKHKLTKKTLLSVTNNLIRRYKFYKIFLKRSLRPAPPPPKTPLELVNEAISKRR